MNIKPIGTILRGVAKFLFCIARAWLAFPFILVASLLFLIGEVLLGDKLCYRAKDVIKSVKATCTECGHTSTIDKILHKDSKGKYKGTGFVQNTVTAL